MHRAFNQRVIEEFRANQGKVDGYFADTRLVLLTTTGARTGAKHTTPVAFLHDTGGRILVIASAAGASKHPDWYHNLRAHPRVTVENGVFTFEAEAEVIQGEEREKLFARAVETDARWGEYQAATNRLIPVVALNPIEGAPNVTAWGDALVAVHTMFRRELALVRKEVAQSGPRLGAQLRINCLTACDGLHHHHTAEDGQMFPALDDAHPELAPVMARLRSEHQTVDRLLSELRERVTAHDVDQAALSADVDRLIAQLEAHLDYEEEQLVPILNAMAP